MAWNVIFWFTTFFITIALLVLNFYQLLVLTDLEADYLNIYDSSSRINKLVIPEFLVQGILCSLFLFTGHWFMFLITVPVSCYHINLYLKREHLIDVTEVFRALRREKYFRFGKLIFYMSLFLIVIFRLVNSKKHHLEKISRGSYIGKVRRPQNPMAYFVRFQRFIRRRRPRTFILIDCDSLIQSLYHEFYSVYG